MSAVLPKKRLVGYADRHSARPGEAIEFKVSSDGIARYHAQIVKLISGDHHLQGLGFIETPVETAVTGDYAGRHQPLPAGSYGIVTAVEGLDTLESFTIQAWVWPTLANGRRQVVAARWIETSRRGFALVLDEKGALGFEAGDGTGVARVGTDRPLPLRYWTFVAAAYDAATRTVRLHQDSAASTGWSPAPFAKEATLSVVPRPEPGSPLLIAASLARRGQGSAIATGHYNGKIDSLRLSDRALSRAEMEALHRPASLPGHLRGAWDFSKEMTTDRILDLSADRRDGTLVNLPARAMKGFNWDGTQFDWKGAPEQYGAIHFHEDDLYDAGWETDFALTVPASLPSGIYAAKLTGEGDTDYVPFVVRPALGAKSADTLVLLPTASYLAYANERAGLEGGGKLHAFANHLTSFGPTDLWLNDHPEVGGSLYDVHSDGSGVCYSSRLRPILNFRPGITNSWIGSDGGAPWQFNADLALISWLEAKSIPYDVITDEDLHEGGYPALAGHRAVLTGSHPEYYSKEMYEALETHLGRGGRLIYLGGNGFYWRVAFHRSLPGVMELRRTEDGIRDWVAEGGEYYHSFTGEYGGMWSRMGRPIAGLAGVDMAAQGFDVSSYYRRTAGSRDPRAAFIFAGIEDEVIGDFGTVGGGAAGIELDRCDKANGSPAHVLVVASSEGHSDTYFPSPEHINNANAAMDGTQNPDVRADMTFYETSSGGAVFSTGSIAWIGSLTFNGCRNNVSQVTENVLRRFLDPTPFRHPMD
ncbi:MAG TPA: LamG domain-containing protein [Hypericibacter adhaerens]|uniref:LamG domain-containing protein n=1 Tax=Hypericibacter adhaerens TaxID=2602016 RepID=UPI002B8F83AC|nr:LamG domain-containing protein [Hypericibacter adhaerens]HWA45687.1 LamG domain-containing protein [Hypericibacter adhaerens]